MRMSNHRIDKSKVESVSPNQRNSEEEGHYEKQTQFCNIGNIHYVVSRYQSMSSANCQCLKMVKNTK